MFGDPLLCQFEQLEGPTGGQRSYMFSSSLTVKTLCCLYSESIHCMQELCCSSMHRLHAWSSLAVLLFPCSPYCCKCLTCHSSSCAAVLALLLQAHSVRGVVAAAPLPPLLLQLPFVCLQSRCFFYAPPERSVIAVITNKLCVSLPTALLQSWRFFYERIQYEEWYLRKFFGQDYEHYTQATPSGIPFIA